MLSNGSISVSIFTRSQLWEYHEWPFTIKHMCLVDQIVEPPPGAQFVPRKVHTDPLLPKNGLMDAITQGVERLLIDDGCQSKKVFLNERIGREALRFFLQDDRVCALSKHFDGLAFTLRGVIEDHAYILIGKTAENLEDTN